MNSACNLHPETLGILMQAIQGYFWLPSIVYLEALAGQEVTVEPMASERRPSVCT